MDERIKQRIAYALKCEPSEVPETQEGLRAALDNRRSELRAKKGVKDGQSIHESL